MSPPHTPISFLLLVQSIQLTKIPFAFFVFLNDSSRFGKELLSRADPGDRKQPLLSCRVNTLATPLLHS